MRPSPSTGRPAHSFTTTAQCAMRTTQSARSSGAAGALDTPRRGTDLVCLSRYGPLIDEAIYCLRSVLSRDNTYGKAAAYLSALLGTRHHFGGHKAVSLQSPLGRGRGSRRRAGGERSSIEVRNLAPANRSDSPWADFSTPVTPQTKEESEPSASS